MHQIQATLATINAALDDATEANPVFLATPDKAEALARLEQITARVAELRLRVIASAQDLAEEVGARDVAAWLIAQQRVESPAAHATLRLARELEGRPVVRARLARGAFSLEHARVILHGLEDLPDDLDPEILTHAEATLCDLAGKHRPKDLRRLTSHLLEVIAPDIAEAAEAAAIQRLEEQAQARATLSITDQGDGTTRIHGIVPETVGHRLRTYLQAYTQPRVAALEADGRVQPRSRLLAHAFAQLLENTDPTRLPAHGGDATTVVVTMTLDQLQADLGVAWLDDGTPISTGETRRLACTAGIIPAVLGGNSEPLDLGRTRRLFTGPQRKALALRDKHCRAEGCTVPTTWCDAHHDQPWSTGGHTDLKHGSLLCGHHHRRAHDPTYETIRLPDGRYRFQHRARRGGVGRHRRRLTLGA
ncbi:DUF222 domain-containing protein [Nocardioides sp. BP30]|uniref:HNH endonuclease signature motif containing protein n=1 Tax=Nocardioides sp. BP30 TaxID=3036374 RepID=UPI00246950FF|nr:HNH endonuclease signature motif containing protein [Nocardioides sp. BP30]WGL50339.1 DUF222 domain-containing protein [Nocardioides sp. BP30]